MIRLEEQMYSISCLLKNPLSWISVVGLVLAGFFGYGFSSSIVVASALASSTLISKFSKQKPILPQDDKSTGDEIVLTSDHQETSPCMEQIASETLQPETESIIVDYKECQEEEKKKEDSSQAEEYLIRSSPRSLSVSESGCVGRSSTTSEDSDWEFQDQSPDFTDGSISDEDSLIEIALSSGHYIGHKDEEEEDYDEDFRFNQQKKLQDFVPGSFFKQHDLMELLAELNDMHIDEENLIEIDISVGSIIKCPMFEIKA